MRGDGKRTELLPAWVDVQCDGDVDWGSKGQVCATMSVVLAHTRRSLNTCNRWEHSDSLQATPTLREQASGLSAHAWISASKFVPPPKPWARVGALLSEEAHVEAVTRESQTAAATKQDTPGPARNSSCPPDHGPRPPSHALSRTPSCICNRASTQVTGSLCRTATATTPRPSHAFFFDKIVNERLECSGRNDGTKWACGRRNHDAKLPSPGAAQDPNKKETSRLVTHSQRFIQSAEAAGAGKSDGVQVLDIGRAFRPSTVSGLPSITAHSLFI